MTELFTETEIIDELNAEIKRRLPDYEFDEVKYPIPEFIIATQENSKPIIARYVYFKNDKIWKIL